MYTRVRAVLAIISARIIDVSMPVIYCGALAMMLNVRSDDMVAYFPLPGYPPERSVMIEVVVLLLLVLYYSVLGVTMVAYVDAHRVSMGNTTTVPVLHMPNQLNVQDGVVPVQLCAQLPAHERHQPAAHEPAADATGLVEHNYTRTMRRAVAGHGPGRRSEAVRSALAARMCF